MDERERKAFSVISELGFQAAEIRALQNQLGAACAYRLHRACGADVPVGRGRANRR